MKKIFLIIMFIILSKPAFGDGNYKKIRKKAEVNKPELIFPVANENIEGCILSLIHI